jgi:hypothetical protein
VTQLHVRGMDLAPRLGVVVPSEGEPGWVDAAYWCALLEAWGIPASRPTASTLDVGEPWTTLVVPAACVDGDLAARLVAVPQVTVLVVGRGTVPPLERVVRFEPSADVLDPSSLEDVVDEAERTLARAAPRGLIGVWRWPRGKDVALVVDGDVDHPTGVDPECARYVAPAIETASRAGFDAYGIFAAAANVDAEPASFPPGAQYYNHSYTHPYSHWSQEPWEALDEERMRQELVRSNETFRRHLGSDDRGIFRLPHFQLEAFDRTADVLEGLGYRAESSIGGNASITGGLPYHPARRSWSARPADAAYARTHPEPSERRPFLQLPISTDPTDPGFPNGCCSYHTLGEGVRNRAAEPDAYEGVLQDVLDRATARRGLSHLFIDPPDAGFGRLPGDRPDYASAVERWLRRAVAREDVAIMTTAGLATWWSERERAVGRLSWRAEDGSVVVDLPDAPDGTTVWVLPPGGGAEQRLPLSAVTA